MADILIVEDARLQKLLIQRFVQSKHTIVGIVETEDRAVNFAIRYEPDVAIMDINLSEGDGITAANRINSYDLDTRIIMSTAVVNKESKTLAKQASVDVYLVKPYSKQELLSTIEQVN